MKKNKRIPHLIFIFQLAIAFLLQVQHGFGQGKGQPSLIGSWDLNYANTLRGIAAPERPKHDSLDQNMKNRVRNFYDKRRFTFAGNGTYIMTQFDGSSRRGQWTLSQDESQLLITDSDSNQKLSYSLIYTANGIIMRLEGAEATAAILRTFHLTRGR